jgi:hypothetical protein
VCRAAWRLAYSSALWGKLSFMTGGGYFIFRGSKV